MSEWQVEMIVVAMPPNKERYIAEVRNLLAFRVCFRIEGRPRATAWELQRALGGSWIGARSVILQGTIVSVRDNHTLIQCFGSSSSDGCRYSRAAHKGSAGRICSWI